MQPYYDDASILCLTSTFEGWGLCLTDAHANGVLHISVDCSACVREILSPSRTNGFLVPCFNIQRYADTLLHMMKDEALLAKMREQVLLKAEDYSTEGVGDKGRRILEALLKQ